MPGCCCGCWVVVREPKKLPPVAGCWPNNPVLGAAADAPAVAGNKLPKVLPVVGAADEAAGKLKLKVLAELDAAALEAPKSDGVAGVPKAGVLGVPNGDGDAPNAGVDDAPKAGVELAPNRDGVLAAGAPKAGVDGAPKAGVLDAPNAGVLDAPKGVDVAADWPKLNPVEGCPNVGVCTPTVQNAASELSDI